MILVWLYLEYCLHSFLVFLMPACEIACIITKHGSIQRELVKILAAAKQPVPDWLDGGALNGGIRRLSKFSHAVIIYEAMKPKQI